MHRWRLCRCGSGSADVGRPLAASFRMRASSGSFAAGRSPIDSIANWIGSHRSKFPPAPFAARFASLYGNFHGLVRLLLPIATEHRRIGRTCIDSRLRLLRDRVDRCSALDMPDVPRSSRRARQFDAADLCQRVRQHQNWVWRARIRPRMASGSGNCYAETLAAQSLGHDRVRPGAVQNDGETNPSGNTRWSRKRCRIPRRLPSPSSPTLHAKRMSLAGFNPTARMPAAMPSSAVMPAQLSLAPGIMQAVAILHGLANRIGGKYCVEMSGK